MDSLLLSRGFIDALIDKEFLQLSFTAGLIIGLLAPIVGTFVIIRRLSFIADTLSHFSLAGISIGFFIAKVLQVTFLTPIYLGIIFSIIGTFLIEKLRNFYKNYKEISMPIVMSLGIALSGIFISKAEGINSNLTNKILFGSINAVSRTDLYTIIAITLFILIVALRYGREFIAHSFDEEYARILGINTTLIQYLFVLILALVISAFIEVIGVLLVSSLMIIPVAAAMQIGKSFKDTMVLSIIFSEISITAGFFMSYYIALPTGPAIVMVNITILFLILFINRLGMRFKKQ